jgi:hypothetical protein
MGMDGHIPHTMLAPSTSTAKSPKKTTKPKKTPKSKKTPKPKKTPKSKKTPNPKKKVAREVRRRLYLIQKMVTIQNIDTYRGNISGLIMPAEECNPEDCVPTVTHRCSYFTNKRPCCRSKFGQHQKTVVIFHVSNDAATSVILLTFCGRFGHVQG